MIGRPVGTCDGCYEYRVLVRCVPAVVSDGVQLCAECHRRWHRADDYAPWIAREVREVRKRQCVMVQ